MFWNWYTTILLFVLATSWVCAMVFSRRKAFAQWCKRVFIFALAAFVSYVTVWVISMFITFAAIAVVPQILLETGNIDSFTAIVSILVGVGYTIRDMRAEHS